MWIIVGVCRRDIPTGIAFPPSGLSLFFPSASRSYNGVGEAVRPLQLPVESGNVLLSRAVSSQVPSALRGLTSVFGMGTGGSLSLLSPEISCALSRPASLSRFRLLRPPRFRSAARAPSQPHSARLTLIRVRQSASSASLHD